MQNSYNSCGELMNNSMFDPSILERPKGGGGGMTCTWEYYGCLLLCGTAIEVPPLFLICAGLCVCQYCSPAPAFCSNSPSSN